MTHQSLEEDSGSGGRAAARCRFSYTDSNNKHQIKSSAGPKQGRNLSPSVGGSSGYTPKSPTQTKTLLDHIIHGPSTEEFQTDSIKKLLSPVTIATGRCQSDDLMLKVFFETSTLIFYPVNVDHIS